MSKPRNPVVRHATILRKGGVHRSTRTAERHNQKQALDDEVEMYFQSRRPTNKKKSDTGANGPRDSIRVLSSIPTSSTPAFVH